MKKHTVYVCGRCGYRSHRHMKCPSCGFMLEEECKKCYSAKGNCICKLHGIFIAGKHIDKTDKVKRAAAKKSKSSAAAKKKKKGKK